MRRLVITVPVYFKSTDGHFHNWDFNIRRANLHLVPLIEKGKGLIVVDSTRRGKRLPDALAKTVPIWCAVINRAVARRYSIPSFDTTLHAPPYAVSPSEHAQIEARMNEWTERLLNSTFDVPRLSKPLVPIWVTPAVPTVPTLSGELDFFPIVCLSASTYIPEGLERRYGYCYVQGSGDDHESWSRGLTSSAFWKDIDRVRETSEEEIHCVIDAIVSEAKALQTPTSWIPITKAQGRVLLGPSPAPYLTDSDIPTIYATTSTPEQDLSASVLVLHVPQGKAGQMRFMEALPRVLHFAASHLEKSTRSSVRIASQSELDPSVGFAMAILEELFESDGTYVRESKRSEHSKSTIRMRLEWIQQSLPGANPSRTIMNRINEYFMSPRAMRHSAK